MTWVFVRAVHVRAKTLFIYHEYPAHHPCAGIYPQTKRNGHTAHIISVGQERIKRDRYEYTKNRMINPSKR